MLSNLPPGVTDRMVDAQYDYDDVEVKDAREWYATHAPEEFANLLSEWLYYAVGGILANDESRPQWFNDMLAEFYPKNDDYIVEQYVEALASGDLFDYAESLEDDV
jgi:hypothetical protein